MPMLVRNNKVIKAGGKVLYRAGNPLDLPNLRLYLSATRMTQQADESNVSSFVDFSSLAYNATQATSSLQPKFDTNQFGVNAGIKFDGVDDVLGLTGGALDIFRNINQYTIQVLCKRSIISTASPIFKAQTNSGAFVRVAIQFQADGTVFTGLRKDDSTITNLFSSSVVNDLNAHLIQVTLSTDNVLSMYIDGVLSSSTTVPTGNIVNTSAQNMQVGANTNISQYGSAIINGISVSQAFANANVIREQYRGYLQRGYL